ncbi:hypothetical protein RB195_025894 [Necator americanus]|uniref:Uncharacterized protein n=1 Tax=Necator americanus TaxID=51031 RepID=A0ABR1EUI6_NECAM
MLTLPNDPVMLVQLQRPITTLAWVMLLYPLVFAISVQGLLILFTYNVQEILFFGITIRFIPEKNASYSPRHPSVAIKTNLLVCLFEYRTQSRCISLFWMK